MKRLFSIFARPNSDRARYERTVAELRAMPFEIALDLGLDPADAERNAARAVFGA